MPFTVAMPLNVTFGSVGDIIAVAQIAAQITSSLSKSKGSAIEYQQLLGELRLLQRALDHLDELSQRTSPKNVQILDSLKFATAACRSPLENFLRKIHKYHKHLNGELEACGDSNRSERPSDAIAPKLTKRESFHFAMTLGSAARKIPFGFTWA
jgi:hypothetical protein